MRVKGSHLVVGLVLVGGAYYLWKKNKAKSAAGK